MRKLVESGTVQARVIAPCPWFPFTSGIFGGYAVFGRTPRNETRHGIQIEHPRYPLLPKIGMSSAPLALLSSVLPRVRREILRGQDFDLIDAHYFYPDGVAAVLLGRAINRPVVVTARGTDLNFISSFAIPNAWIRWAARNAAGLITVSSGLKRKLVGLGVAPDRIRMLRNGVDIATFCPSNRVTARRDLGFSRPTLLAVGNLIPLKRHVLIVEALQNLDGVDLVLVGDGPERARIIARAKQLGVSDRVRLLGRQPQELLPKIYSAADLLIHPSIREGWPNVLLEAMACGTAAVVTSFDGAADIVAAPEAGRIIEQATPEVLAAAVGQLLSAPPDRESTRRYAVAFDWQSTTTGQIELFHEVCQQSSSRQKNGAGRTPRAQRSDATL